MVFSDFSSGFLLDFAFCLYPSLRWRCTTDQVASPDPSSAITKSRTPHSGDVCPERSQIVLHGCYPKVRGYIRFSGAFVALPRWTGSALSYSPYKEDMPALQVSLYVTGCCFASLPQEITTRQHNQSPSYIG